MRLVSAGLCSFLLLTGCSVTPTAGPNLGVEPDGLQGKIFGGQQPVSGATVSVYEVGSGSYGAASTTPKASVTTDLNGNFSFPASGAGSYTCTAANTPMYLVASGGTPGGFSLNANLALMALVPACQAGRTATIIIDEVTTAAAVFAAGQFMNTTLGTGVVPQIGATCSGCATGTYNAGLVNAFSNTYSALVNNVTGQSVLSSVTNGVTVTRESDKLSTIANVLAACVNSNGTTSLTETTSNCGKLFTGVNAKSASPRPYNTIQAALLMDLYPYYNVIAVYGLISSMPPFQSLATAPHDWTVGISYTTANLGLGIQQNTTASIDIDAAGNIWFPSNKTGAAGIASFSPSTTTFSSVVAGSGLTYPQYVAVDTAAPAYAWTADMSSGKVLGAPTATGSVKLLTGSYGAGGPVSVDAVNTVVLGTTVSPYTVEYVNSSRAAVTASSLATATVPNTVVVESGSSFPSFVFAGDTTTACRLEFVTSPVSVKASTGSTTCLTGSADSTYIGASDALNNGKDTIGEALIALPTSTNAICFELDGFNSACTAFPTLNVPTANVFDGAGNLIVANSGNASISEYSPSFTYPDPFTQDYAPVAVGNGYFHGSSYGATLSTPYAIAVDASGNVWVANAGCVATGATHCSATSFTLSEIVGAAVPAITPRIAAQNAASSGDPMSPQQ